MFQPFTHCPAACSALGLGPVTVGWGELPENTQAASCLEEVELWVNKTHLAKEQAILTHPPSGLTSASLLVRVENVPLLAPAGVRARRVDAEVGTVVFQDAAHVDRCKRRRRK